MNELEINMNFPTNVVKICKNSIGLETFHDGTKRSDIKLSYSKNNLNLYIKSEDLSSLRASVNTYLRLIIMCSDLILSEG